MGDVLTSVMGSEPVNFASIVEKIQSRRESLLEGSGSVAPPQDPAPKDTEPSKPLRRTLVSIDDEEIVTYHIEITTENPTNKNIPARFSENETEEYLAEFEWATLDDISIRRAKSKDAEKEEKPKVEAKAKEEPFFSETREPEGESMSKAKDEAEEPVPEVKEEEKEVTPETEEKDKVIADDDTMSLTTHSTSSLVSDFATITTTRDDRTGVDKLLDAIMDTVPCVCMDEEEDAVFEEKETVAKFMAKKIQRGRQRSLMKKSGVEMVSTVEKSKTSAPKKEGKKKKGRRPLVKKKISSMFPPKSKKSSNEKSISKKASDVRAEDEKEQPKVPSPLAASTKANTDKLVALVAEHVSEQEKGKENEKAAPPIPLYTMKDIPLNSMKDEHDVNTADGKDGSLFHSLSTMSQLSSMSNAMSSVSQSSSKGFSVADFHQKKLEQRAAREAAREAAKAEKAKEPPAIVLEPLGPEKQNGIVNPPYELKEKQDTDITANTKSTGNETHSMSCDTMGEGDVTTNNEEEDPANNEEEHEEDVVNDDDDDNYGDDDDDDDDDDYTGEYSYTIEEDASIIDDGTHHDGDTLEGDETLQDDDSDSDSDSEYTTEVVQVDFDPIKLADTSDEDMYLAREVLRRYADMTGVSLDELIEDVVDESIASITLSTFPTIKRN